MTPALRDSRDDRAAEIAARLDEVVSRKRLLEHPFYEAWAAGTLTTEDLNVYSRQYWRQVESFPRYLECLSDRLPDGVAKKTVLENLSDERDDDHPGLWLDFAAALGAPAQEVYGTAPEAETTNCVKTFELSCGEAPVPFALGMLYAYESQTPEVATTKVAGLREHYGIDGTAVKYFELHGELDVEHSRGLAEALAEVAQSEEDIRQAEAGAATGAGAIWGLLDGVARVRDLD
jgi:pyrroloquinoline-quinone synthase